MAALELGTLVEAAKWIEDEPAIADQRLRRCFLAARELVTADVSLERVGAAPYPDALHLATLLKTAMLFGRRLSTYGVEALQLGGEAGGFLTYDPHYMALIRPYRKPRIGAAAKTDKGRVLLDGSAVNELNAAG